SEKIMLKQKIERDDVSEKRHHASDTDSKAGAATLPRMSAFREQ
ncbi:MAG: hypothetical protein JWP25_87, partial [Bradyrhizobium sp.]|nr:hypothetical protein [Bradyrhizobium sp.]